MGFFGTLARKIGLKKLSPEEINAKVENIQEEYKSFSATIEKIKKSIIGRINNVLVPLEVVNAGYTVKSGPGRQMYDRYRNLFTQAINAIRMYPTKLESRLESQQDLIDISKFKTAGKSDVAFLRLNLNNLLRLALAEHYQNEGNTEKAKKYYKQYLENS